MSRYCTKCGKELTEGNRCSCQQTKESDFTTKLKNFIGNIFTKTGIIDSNENVEVSLETGKRIVPDSIKANEGETPIKQYNVAVLRSRIKGNYAKGKLQVTNKRVLFRAPGYSFKGKILVQHEFDVNEISGVEIQKNNRISFLNVVLSIVAAGLICSLVSSVFKEFSYKADILALILSLAIGIACTIPFFIIKKHFWLKMLIMDCGLGAVLGTSGMGNISKMSFLSGISTNIADFLGVVILCVWMLNMILVSIVPDLTLCIKTKSASEAITIRRKQRATLFKQEIEYTGFSEVVPDKDIDILSNEIGALIDDIQTFGDGAISMWMNNEQE